MKNDSIRTDRNGRVMKDRIETEKSEKDRIRTERIGGVINDRLRTDRNGVVKMTE